MKIFVISFLSLVLIACTNNNHLTKQSSNMQNTDQQTQHQKPTVTGIWIDVRSNDEYQAGHLVSAINIPVEQIAHDIASITNNKNAIINLYCRSGRRAENARAILLQMGYTNVINHGGFDQLQSIYQSTP